MNEFTDKNEQAFLDACGAIGVEPNAMVNTHKKRYLVSEYLKNPVSWLDTEILYHSYTTRGEAQTACGMSIVRLAISRLKPNQIRQRRLTVRLQLAAVDH